MPFAFFFKIGGQFNKDVTYSLAFKSQHSNLEDDQSDLQYINAHPKPLAVSLCHLFALLFFTYKHTMKVKKEQNSYNCCC